jgi:signal transduction histidine kinase
VSQRQDEVGLAERELAGMQRDLASMLQQKNHLAALGLAVSKINHDLRNLLTSAQLFSEGLSSLARSAGAAFRAEADAGARARHCVLRVDAVLRPRARAAARPEAGRVEALVEEVHETLALAESRIAWIAAIERGLIVDADPDQLAPRVAQSGANAVQALETRAPNDPARDQVRITGRREGAVAVIEVSDTGRASRSGRANTCSRPSSRPRAAAEPARASPSPPSSSAPTAARSSSWRAPLAQPSGSPFPDRAVELDAHRSARARA